MRRPFDIKNARRREHFDKRNKEHRAARKRRRLLNGAFGRLPERDYNRLVIGTSGAERKVRDQDAVNDLEQMIGGA